MLELKNVNVTLGGRQILHDINLKLIPHTFTALIGRNGCGKSTLVSCIDQSAAYTGEVLFGSRSLALMRPKERACLVSALPQHLHAPHITVESLVSMGRNPYLDLSRRMREEDRSAVFEAMEAAGVRDLAAQCLDTLSGGERQKAYLAMMLAQDTRVMVLDEPTTYTDLPYEHAILNLLRQLRDTRKKTVLAVMHDLSAAVRYADRIAVMDAGRILFCGSREACLREEIIEKTFSVQRCTCGDQIFFTAK